MARWLIIVTLSLTQAAFASETLTYKIKYLGIIPFGKARLNIEANHQDVTLFPSKPVWFVSKLNATFSVQKNNHLTTYNEDIENQIGASDHKTLVYDYKNNILEYTRGEFKGVRKKIRPEILDPFSFLSKLRMISFEKGKVHEFLLNTNQSNYVLKCLVEKEEKQKGKDTWKIHTTLQREDKLHKRPKLTIDIWLTKDASIPVLAKANTLIGPVTVSLIE